MSFEKPVVVLDNGSYNVKAGFSCDNHPVCIFRTVVGRPKYLQGSYGKEDYEVHIGEEAVAKINDLELNCPVVNGKIVHWDNIERIWHHCFYRELKVAPEDRSVLLGCASTTTIAEKIKCCEVFFETLNSPGLCIQPQSVLSLYGSGFTTGLSVDLGYDTTDINPVYEGGQITYAHTQTKLSGKHVIEYIQEQLIKRNLDIGSNMNDLIEGVKTNMYLTKYACCLPDAYHKKYKLPSGEEVDVSHEAFMSAELLFQPDFVYGSKTNYMPLHRAVVMTALKCDSELHNDLYNAIVPCGGMATIPGLRERLQHEIETFTQKPCNVLYSAEPYTVTWLGGATFAGMPGAKKIWITKKQYDEYGIKIVKNKFL